MDKYALTDDMQVILRSTGYFMPKAGQEGQPTSFDQVHSEAIGYG